MKNTDALRKELKSKKNDLEKAENKLLKSIAGLESRRIGAQDKLLSAEKMCSELKRDFKAAVVDERETASIEKQTMEFTEQIEKLRETITILTEKLETETADLVNVRQQIETLKLDFAVPDLIEACRVFNDLGQQMAVAMHKIDVAMNQAGGATSKNVTDNVRLSNPNNDLISILFYSVKAIPRIKIDEEEFKHEGIHYFWRQENDCLDAVKFTPNQHVINPFISEAV